MQTTKSLNLQLSQNTSSIIVKTISYTLLAILGASMVLPFVWMILGTFKTSAEIFTNAFFPKSLYLGNYIQVLETSGFNAWYLNSFIVAMISTTSVVFFDTLAGFTFAKYEFPLKRLFFIIILSTLMIPTEMLIIPWYVMAVENSWVDTYWGIAFPGVITAGGVFLMRQFMKGVPDELIDAARIDGLNEFQIYFRVAIPLSMPAVGALAIFNFLGNWNAFLWPLIATSDRAMMTLPVGMLFFSNEASSAWELIMTGATLSVLPLITVFLFFQRYIIQGITLTGLKG
jgi:multiple sugar transport system permease protein